MRYVEASAGALAIVVLLSMPAAAEVYSFEDLTEGHVLVSADFGSEIMLSVTTNGSSAAGSAVVFDSSCRRGCSGDDLDLLTPGTGAGNNNPQGHILVIRGDGDSPGGDGDNPGGDGSRHDDHDSDSDSDGQRGHHRARSLLQLGSIRGGTVELVFARPHKVYSLRILNVGPAAAGSHLEIDRVDGQVQVLAFAQLGVNSAQTIAIADPQPATALRIILAGAAGLDDIDLEPACGDGLVDSGEVCDPPDERLCGHDCLPVSLCVDASNAAINDNASCSDGDSMCTFRDTCAAGMCIGEPLCRPGCERCDAGSCTSLCGNPHDPQVDAITISDALFSLRASVGLESCALCVCDVNNDSRIAPSDTLITLRSIVLLPTVFDCSPLATTPLP